MSEELVTEQGTYCLVQIQICESHRADYGSIVVYLDKNWRKAPPKKSYTSDIRARDSEVDDDADETPAKIPLHVGFTYQYMTQLPSGKFIDDTDDTERSLKQGVAEALAPMIPDLIVRLQDSDKENFDDEADVPVLFQFDGLKWIYKGIVDLKDIAMMLKALKLLSVKEAA